MPYSLLREPWLPVRRASGPAWIRPAQLTESLAFDPVLALDWPRPDFRIAGLEFLIGLLATACPPSDRRDWTQRWRTPPTPEELDAAFTPLAHAFDLDGPGPRFMQDFEDIQAEPNDIAGLLIEAPGEQTLKRNADLLVKRGQATRLGREAAAMALFALQTAAPAGGAGNRTGLRGGGPLTTLAIPPRVGPLLLWHLLWANTPLGAPPAAKDLPRILPWLAPTRTSEAGQTISQTADHDLLNFWAMPRRIRLDFRTTEAGEHCDLTGLPGPVFATSWRQRPYGANYQSFEHPLSPHYRPKPKEKILLPVHPQPGGIGYRHFLGLLVPTDAGKPAACIAEFETHRLGRCAVDGDYAWRILAAGYDMDNMKARSFVEAELPVFAPSDPARRDKCANTTKTLIGGAKEAADLLRRAVRMALFAEGAKPALDAGLFATLRARFWTDTEPAFYAGMKAASLADPDPTPDETISGHFLAAIRPILRRLFDEAAPILGSDRPDRIADAARMLSLALNGYGKPGSALFDALHLPIPEPAAKPKVKRKTG